MMAEPFHDMPYDSEHIMNRGAASCTGTSPYPAQRIRCDVRISIPTSFVYVIVSVVATCEPTDASSAHAFAGTKTCACSAAWPGRSCSTHFPVPSRILRFDASPGAFVRVVTPHH